MTTSIKTCFKCLEVKLLTEFYKHSQMADGHLNKCKECAKRDANQHRADNLEQAKEYDRHRGGLPHRRLARDRYAKTERGKCRHRAGKMAYHQRHPLKRAAHIETGNAIRDGKIARQPCEKCGEVRSEAHHDDYSKPLDVRWLCKKHHDEHHAALRELARR